MRWFLKDIMIGWIVGTGVAYLQLYYDLNFFEYNASIVFFVVAYLYLVEKYR